jgi:hypothetical protein
MWSRKTTSLAQDSTKFPEAKFPEAGACEDTTFFKSPVHLYSVYYSSGNFGLLFLCTTSE